MALLRRHEEADSLWGIWRMDESPEALAAAIGDEALVAEAEARFSAPHRRQEWLTARLLIDTLLGRHSHVAYYPSGRPYLTDAGGEVSISHTRGYVAVIISRYTVGIDIECVGRRVERVASRFMREDEPLMLYQRDALASLLLHWSAKETMFKCMDASEVDFKEHLRLFPFQPQEQGVLEAEEYKTPRRLHFRIQYLLHPDFVLTYTVAPAASVG